MTAEGFRPHPSIEELLGQQSVPQPQPPKHAPAYPLLVTAKWCPFTLKAAEFWSEAAKAAGQTLTIVDAGSDEGRAALLHANGAGVPCVATAPGRLIHGIMTVSAEEARSFLNESLAYTA